MSDAWQAFQKALNADPALQAQLKAAYQEALHSVASAAGFDLSASAELDDDDVLGLVGGLGNGPGATGAYMSGLGSPTSSQITYPN